MLTIRAAQLEAFELARFPEFQETLVSHFREFAPFYAATLAESEQREFVGAACQRAAEHGFTYRATVTFYLELSVLLGIGFDCDPQYAYVTDSLTEPTLPEQMERADVVWEDVNDYLEVVVGDDFGLYTAALRRLSQLTVDSFDASSGNTESILLESIARVYPEKFDYVGEEAVQALFESAEARCLELDLDCVTGAPLLVFTMFFLGHACIQDPLFPWIRRSIETSRRLAPAERVRRLHSKLTLYLAEYLKREAQSE